VKSVVQFRKRTTIGVAHPAATKARMVEEKAGDVRGMIVRGMAGEVLDFYSSDHHSCDKSCRKRKILTDSRTDFMERAVQSLFAASAALFVPLIDSPILHHGDHFATNRKKQKTSRSVLVRFFRIKMLFARFLCQL
jgi:hypothetical protein